MKIAELEAFKQPLALKTVPDPQLGPTDVLVESDVCSICNTDWHAWRGDWPLQLPIVLGHQLAGRVAAVGEAVTKVSVGDRVLSNFAISCGDCYYCRHGYDNICAHWQVLGLTRQGGFAEQVAIPERALERLPEGMSGEEASLLTCGFGTPYRAFMDAEIKPGEVVLILGGILWGLASIQLVHLAGGVAVVADADERRLKQAEAHGADGVLKVGVDDLMEAGKQRTEGRGWDVVLDYSADADLIGRALLATRRRGRLCLVGQATRMKPLEAVLEKLIFEEIIVRGAFLARQSDMQDLLQIYRQGKLAIAPLVSHRLSFSEIDRGFQLMDTEAPTAVVIHIHR